MAAKIRVDVLVTSPSQPSLRTEGWVTTGHVAVFKADAGSWGVLTDWEWMGPREVSGWDATPLWKFASMRDALAAGEAKP